MILKNDILVVLALIVLSCFAGCAKSGFRIEPLSNHDTAHLSLQDIVGLMLRAGFNDDEIHLYSEDLRKAFMKSGAARVYIDGVEEVTFTVDGNSVYVSSKSKGKFFYNLRQ